MDKANAVSDPTPPHAKIPKWLARLVVGIAFAATAFVSTSHAAPLPKIESDPQDNAQAFLGATFDHGGISPFRQSINERAKKQIENYLQRTAGLSQELDDCQKNPQAHPPREAVWSQSMATAQQLGDPMLAIDTAQLVFNTSIGYDKKKEVDAKWAENPNFILSMEDLARRGMGTCFDYAIAKYEWLSRVIGPENVRILIGFAIDPQTHEIQAHAVCAARANGHFFILDHPTVQSMQAIAKAGEKAIIATTDKLSFAEDASRYLDENGPRDGIKLNTAKGLFIPLIEAGGANGLQDFKSFNNVSGIFWTGILYRSPEKIPASGETFETHQARMAENFWENKSRLTDSLQDLMRSCLGLHPSVLPPEDIKPPGQSDDYGKGIKASTAIVRSVESPKQKIRGAGPPI